MNCPSCSTPIGEHVTEYGDMACANCGLAGSSDVLDVLAFNLEQLKQLLAEVERLKSPTVVLAEAERLCKAAHVSEVQFYGHQTWLQAPWTEGVCGPTLAEAYEELTKGERNG